MPSFTSISPKKLILARSAVAWFALDYARQAESHQWLVRLCCCPTLVVEQVNAPARGWLVTNRRIYGEHTNMMPWRPD